MHAYIVQRRDANVPRSNLTVKQRKFVNAFMKSGNCTQAAIKAGYSKKTAGAIGQENLKKPTIAAEINTRMAKQERKGAASSAEILDFYTNVMRGNVKEENVVATPQGAQKESTAPQIKDRIAAAKELAKRHIALSPLDGARLRKLNAEASVKESQARDADTSDNEQRTQLSELLNSIEGQVNARHAKKKE